MNAISTPNAPQPAGHYSQAIVHNGIIYVSGQLAIDPATGEKRLGSIEEQTEQALRNVAAILEAAGSDLAHVLKTTVYIADMSLWGASTRSTPAISASIDRRGPLCRRKSCITAS